MREGAATGREGGRGNTDLALDAAHAEAPGHQDTVRTPQLQLLWAEKA